MATTHDLLENVLCAKPCWHQVCGMTMLTTQGRMFFLTSVEYRKSGCFWAAWSRFYIHCSISRDRGLPVLVTSRRCRYLVNHHVCSFHPWYFKIKRPQGFLYRLNLNLSGQLRSGSSFRKSGKLTNGHLSCTRGVHFVKLRLYKRLEDLGVLRSKFPVHKQGRDYRNETQLSC